MSGLRHVCCDDETGEIITYLVNDETGEPAQSGPSAAPAVAPRCVRQPSVAPVPIKFPKGYMSETKKFQVLKEQIMQGSNVFSPRLLIIPIGAVCPAVFIMLLMILEVFLHVLCHKENKLLKDPKLYYRSPLHMITSIFCAVCRECDSSTKIGQMQDQRRCHYDYLKGMAI